MTSTSQKESEIQYERVIRQYTIVWHTTYCIPMSEPCEERFSRTVLMGVKDCEILDSGWVSLAKKGNEERNRTYREASWKLDFPMMESRREGCSRSVCVFLSYTRVLPKNYRCRVSFQSLQIKYTRTTKLGKPNKFSKSKKGLRVRHVINKTNEPIWVEEHLKKRMARCNI